MKFCLLIDFKRFLMTHANWWTVKLWAITVLLVLVCSQHLEGDNSDQQQHMSAEDLEAELKKVHEEVNNLLSRFRIN
jgi:cytochrome b